MLMINPAEGEMDRLRVGQEARITIDALDDGAFTATVDRINPSVDPASSTVKVRLSIPEAIRADLREGAFARVRLVMETHEDVLLVPRDAVVEDNARDYLFLVSETDPVPEPAGADGAELPGPPEDARWARRVEVTVGLEDSRHAEVVEGVDADDLVITMGQKNLKHGARVRLSSADEEVAAREGLSVEEALQAAESRRRALSRAGDAPAEPDADGEGE
jgi:membrane fusion protein (multidrug efflux system)